MFKTLYILIFTILLFVLGFYFVDIYAPRVEKTLENEIKKSLIKSKFRDVKVDIEGRDVTLTGHVLKLGGISKVESLAQSILGVGSVINNVSVKEKKITTANPQKNSQKNTSDLPVIDESLKAELAKLDKEISSSEVPPLSAKLPNELPKISEEVEVANVAIKKLEPTEAMEQIVTNDKVSSVSKEVKNTALPKLLASKTKRKKELKTENNDKKLIKEEAEIISSTNNKEHKVDSKTRVEVNLPVKRTQTEKSPKPKAVKEVAPKNILAKKSVAKPSVKPKSFQGSINRSVNISCREKIGYLTSRNLIQFVPGTKYIEYKTGNVLGKIGKILKTCPRSKLIVTSYGYDNLAAKRANMVAEFLKNLEQIPQVVSTKVKREAAVGNPIKFSIIDR